MKPVRQFIKPRYLIWLLVLPLLVIALRSVPAGEVITTLRGLSLAQLAVIALLNVIIVFLFSSRWWLFLRLQGYRLPYLSLVGYRLSAFGISYFTPGPQFGGEPLQVHLLRERHALPASAAIASVSLDKLVELMTNFTFVAAGSLVMLRMGAFIQLPLAPMAVIFVLLLALPGAYFVALWAGKRPLSDLKDVFYGRFHRSSRIQAILRVSSASEQDMAVLVSRKPVALFLAVFLSLMIWICLLVEYRLMVIFLDQPVSWAATVYLLTAARIAFLLPSPGALGTLEVGQVLAMQSLGFSPALGISLSLLIRARDLALGSFGLWLGAYLVQRGARKSLPLPANDPLCLDC